MRLGCGACHVFDVALQRRAVVDGAELIRLAQAAAADRSGTLTPDTLNSAVFRVAARTGVDFAATERREIAGRRPLGDRG